MNLITFDHYSLNLFINIIFNKCIQNSNNYIDNHYRNQLNFIFISKNQLYIEKLSSIHISLKFFYLGFIRLYSFFIHFCSLSSFYSKKKKLLKYIRKFIKKKNY